MQFSILLGSFQLMSPHVSVVWISLYLISFEISVRTMNEQKAIWSTKSPVQCPIQNIRL